MIKQDELYKIYKYISIYDQSKNKDSNMRFFINKDTDVKIGIKENPSEVIIAFYNSKKSFKFINDYSVFRKKYNNLDLSEKEKSKNAYEEYISEYGEDKTLKYFLNKKLNNPYRSYNFDPKLFNLDIGLNCYEFYNNRKKYYIHSGFIELFQSVSDFYYDTVNKYLKNTNKKIIIIGFSFASVVARICYLNYFLAHPYELNRCEAYLYSTPNIGNKYFERFYAKLHLNEKNRHLYIINCNDDCMYNLLSKQYGFHHIKSTLLFRRGLENSKIYDSNKYCKIIEDIIK